eukprot:GHRR01000970.1.p1 GENE.GHRR01000970.1~~GHRR01000970.1.p1  ORF type:complete len:116 (+),score=40.58 GHRR01000970.1:157-504(+)
MEGVFNKVSGLLGGYLSDQGKLEPIISKAFGMFDRDGSGYIDGPEAKACADKVLGMIGLSNVPTSHIDSVFNKVAGPDQKLDKAEFGKLMHELLRRVEGTGAAGAAAAGVEHARA